MLTSQKMSDWFEKSNNCTWHFSNEIWNKKCKKWHRNCASLVGYNGDGQSKTNLSLRMNCNFIYFLLFPLFICTLSMCNEMNMSYVNPTAKKLQSIQSFINVIPDTNFSNFAFLFNSLETESDLDLSKILEDSLWISKRNSKGVHCFFIG